MRNHVEYTEDVTASRWEKIVRNSENAYFYHTPMWADILERTYGYKTATRLYEIDGTEILVPMMKLKWHGFYNYVSMPMGYGGIFSESEVSAGAIEIIFNNLKQSMGMRSLLCTIFFHPFFAAPIHTDPYIISAGTDMNYTHILSLGGGYESIWEGDFTRKNRNVIRKAEKNGVEVFRGTTSSDCESYYRMYLDSADRWKAKARHSFDLYVELLRHDDNTKLWLARVEDEIIAGIITMEYSGNIISFGGASLSEYWKYAANNLLYKDAVEYACEKGYEYFDFGQSGELYGVRKFKEVFGAKKVGLRKYVIFSRLGRVGNTVLSKY
jgi:hypothetical protein